MQARDMTHVEAMKVNLLLLNSKRATMKNIKTNEMKVSIQTEVNRQRLIKLHCVALKL